MHHRDLWRQIGRRCRDVSILLHQGLRGQLSPLSSVQFCAAAGHTTFEYLVCILLHVDNYVQFYGNIAFKVQSSTRIAEPTAHAQAVDTRPSFIVPTRPRYEATHSGLLYRFVNVVAWYPRRIRGYVLRGSNCHLPRLLLFPLH